MRTFFTVADFKELAIPILHRLIAVGRKIRWWSVAPAST